MALPIERWARQAVLLERRRDFSPVASKAVWDDINDAKALQYQTWRRRQHALNESGEPQALEGIYAGLNALPNAADLTTKTSISGEVGLLSAAETALFMPINPNGLMTPEAFRVAITGNMTTSTSPANLTITPRIGTTTGGITLGASSAGALTASITGAFFYIIGDLTFRSIGAPGANSVCIGLFHFMNTNVAGSGAVSLNLIFGHTPASFDASVAQGLFFGLTHTVTTVTYTPRQVHWMSWN